MDTRGIGKTSEVSSLKPMSVAIGLKDTTPLVTDDVIGMHDGNGNRLPKQRWVVVTGMIRE